MKIIVIGGGFAGVNLVQALSGKEGFEVTLVDKNNYNFFPPLIYQVGTAFLEPSSISYPFRKLLKGKKNLHFRLGELVKVVPDENKVILTNGELVYDCLVFATGAETNYFGMDHVRNNAIPMKTLEDAINMRNRLLQQIEQASITKDPSEIKKMLTIVVAGGGPTGVELSGMFAEMRNNILNKEYPELVGMEGTIYLVDGGKALLKPMSEKSQQHTYNELTELGVQIKLNCHVNDFINDNVTLSSGEIIETKTLIWAAGVTAMTFEGMPEGCYGRGNRLLVDSLNKVKKTNNIYAIGDTCIMLDDPHFPDGHPQLAQVAIQQGKNLAKNLLLGVQQKPLKPFVYHDKGSMAIIGKNKAVADLPRPKIHLHGFFAWFAWLFIHILSLITYRNRVKTFYNWMIAYFTKDQSLRLIIRAPKK